MPAATLLQIKVTLRAVRPPIWRRLCVPGKATLAELHHVLQIAMGWTDTHLHQFRVGGTYVGPLDPDDDSGAVDVDERKVRLEQIAAVRSRFLYEYDLGDGWQHEIRVERVVPATDAAALFACLDGRRNCPPEDCGGSEGYAALVRALADPNHPDHADLREWSGPYWRPEDFDLDFVNARLGKLHPPSRRKPAATASRA